MSDVTHWIFKKFFITDFGNKCTNDYSGARAIAVHTVFIVVSVIFVFSAGL